MHVTVLGTGGTIASTAGEDGATATLTGADLLAAVPGLESSAEPTVEEVAQRLSFEMDRETVETIGDRVAALDEAGDTDAVVVTHGTDTMEETAYYLDLAVDPSIPVILTGAQRRSDELSPDGPPNLRVAFRAAAAFADRDGSGTFVAFNEEVHAARAVTKAHTAKLEAFQSPTRGPVAVAYRDELAINRPPRSESTTIPSRDLSGDVAVVTSGVGVGGEAVRRAIDRGVDGLVVQGTGVGNVTRPLGRAVDEATGAGIPVVVASRCFDGRTEAVYGGVGGSQRLADYGAIFAGDLPAHKARLKLLLALPASDDPEAVRAVFEEADTTGA